MTCPKPEVLSQWADGSLDARESLAVGRHAEACPACRSKADDLLPVLGPIPSLAQHKWYVDEIYDFLIVKPIWVLSHIFFLLDKLLVDGLVNAFGLVPRGIGKLVRRQQTGVLHTGRLGILVQEGSPPIERGLPGVAARGRGAGRAPGTLLADLGTQRLFVFQQSRWSGTSQAAHRTKALPRMLALQKAQSTSLVGAGSFIRVIILARGNADQRCLPGPRPAGKS